MQDKRVLVWGMSDNHAGTEAIISSICRHLPDVRFDFLCYENIDSYGDLFQDVFEKNRYYVIPQKLKTPIKYFHALWTFFFQHGHEYSAVWVNVNEASNIDVLKMAYRWKIPHRIVHSHSSRLNSLLITRVFHRINKPFCRLLSTNRWACSYDAGKFLFHPADFTVIPNMVDANSYRFSNIGRRHIRDKFGIPYDAKVIGFIGRFVDVKNPRFVLDVSLKVMREDPRWYLLMVGDGGLRDELVSSLTDMDDCISSRVKFAGAVTDTTEYYSAFDVYLQPSLFEGLSVSLLEAQYNGLPCIVSDRISPEGIISHNVNRLSLDDPGWVNTILVSKRNPDCMDPELAQRFDIANFNKIVRPMIMDAFGGGDK